jgi:CheY-like chemotaxis protein
MRVLVVEDDPYKLQRLQAFVGDALRGADIIACKSYQSGLQEAIEGSPDIIVLDMSLPTYEVTATESGGRSRPFGGREILDEIKRKGQCPWVIVVTGLPSFGEGKEKMSLDQMKAILRVEFAGMYRGTIYYHASESEWQAALQRELLEAAAELNKNACSNDR